MSSGKEISDAIFVRTLREYQIETIPSDSDFIQRTPTVCEMNQLLATTKLQIYNEEMSTLYAPGYRYPILETIICKD